MVRVESGTASKDDIAQLRQLLKDNGMVWGGMPGEGKNQPAAPTEEDLPDLPDPDYP